MLLNKFRLSKKEKIIDRVRKLFNNSSSEWVTFEGSYSDFAAVSDNLCGGVGYNADAIFEKVSSAALKVRDGKACFERDGYLFYEEEFDLELLAAFYEIAMTDKKISVLDYGGSFGSTFFQNKRKLYQLTIPIQWNIIEQEHFITFGQANLENEILHFYRKIEEIGEYNAVLFSAALQYIENYREVLNKIFSDSPRFIITDRVTVSDENYVCVERVHEPIYEASYSVYVFAEEDFIRIFTDAGYRIESEWIKNRNWAYNADGKLIYEKSYFWIKC